MKFVFGQDNCWPSR